MSNFRAMTISHSMDAHHSAGNSYSDCVPTMQDNYDNSAKALSYPPEYRPHAMNGIVNRGPPDRYYSPDTSERYSMARGGPGYGYYKNGYSKPHPGHYNGLMMDESGGERSEDDSHSTVDDCHSVTSSKATFTKYKSPRITEWLLSNYEAVDGVSMPRSDLYDHYISFCKETDSNPINAASFGKLIRAVFSNLKTRRLGTRGNSKYHYYGIKLRSGAFDAKKPSPHTPESRGPARSGPPEYIAPSMNADFKAPDLGQIDLSVLGPDISPAIASEFSQLYKTQCNRVLQLVVCNSFAEVERVLLHFWQEFPPNMSYVFTDPAVTQFIINADILLFEAIIQECLPCVLQLIPVSLTQSLRYFAKNLEIWIANAMEGISENLTSQKLEIARSFCQALKRHTSLNHLAQAARA
eukprot:Sdes_comp21467_c0_seq1m20097